MMTSQKKTDLTSTAGEVIPRIVSLKYTLKQHIEQSEHILQGSPPEETDPNIESVAESPEDKEATQVVNIVRKVILTEAERRFSLVESEDFYRFATYFDPRYKSKFFSSGHITNQVKSSID